MKVAIVGKAGLGAVEMRGRAVAKLLGLPFIDLRKLDGRERFDTILLVKYWDDKASILRRCCDRLVHDCLDCWESHKKWHHVVPAEFWRWVHKQVPADEIVATSDAASQTMQATGTRIVLAPHHADPCVKADWYDPNGPIVYAGGARFIESQLTEIAQACQRIGRKLVVDTNRDAQKALQGAALSLCLRLPPTDTPLAAHCKPQVKVENAAAANLKCLASDHPCVRGRHDANLYLYKPGDHWEGVLSRILAEDVRLSNPVTLEQHAARIKEILGC